MRTIRRLLLELADATPEQQQEALSRLPPSVQRALAEDWEARALRGQEIFEGDWRTWLIMAGRGFGKTRAGAEWVLARARAHPEARIALVGGSLDEAAKVMIEGESGLLACAGTGERLTWRPTIGRLRFPSGAIALLYSGASPARLRGPQHHFAWADEIAKWAKPEESWDMLQMGLRLGSRPQAVVTTTPKRLALLDRLRDDPATVVRRGRTFDNIHLPAAFVEAMRASYEGTRLGRQELDGELLDEAEGALWPRDMLERCRVQMPDAEKLVRVVIGVDPPASDGGDACGIVVCGLLRDGRGVVLADRSVSGARPEGWARAVAAAADAWRADRVIAEINNGGQMVESVLRTVAPGLPIKPVHASRGKAARAEPVAAAFEAGKCLLAGCFPELEDELTALTHAGFSGGGSPDRADAMVWALTELVVRAPPEPRVRRL